MRYLTFGLALCGAVLGLLVGLFLNGNAFTEIAHAAGQHAHFWLAVITWFASLIGTVGGIWMFIKPKHGALMAIAASVIGIFGSMGLWLLPGSFFFTTALLGFFISSDQQSLMLD